MAAAGKQQQLVVVEAASGDSDGVLESRLMSRVLLKTVPLDRKKLAVDDFDGCWLKETSALLLKKSDCCWFGEDAAEAFGGCCGCCSGSWAWQDVVRSC